MNCVRRIPIFLKWLCRKNTWYTEVNKKVTDIQGSLTSFEQEYVKNKGSMRNIQKLEEKFDQKHNAWLTP
ncbi:hypothetical protein AYJ08_08190 [Brevibacillus sp. SKDU10]|nr:hypothetical protein AYJ08_08190 [Brevibacillus sp. SKDU10]